MPKPPEVLTRSTASPRAKVLGAVAFAAALALAALAGDAHAAAPPPPDPAPPLAYTRAELAHAIMLEDWAGVVLERDPGDGVWPYTVSARCASARRCTVRYAWVSADGQAIARGRVELSRCAPRRKIKRNALYAIGTPYRWGARVVVKRSGPRAGGAVCVARIKGWSR